MNSPYLFSVPKQKQIRVIVHTDCKNEADDQYALVHHLLTPRFCIKGVIAGHFEGKQGQGQGRSMDQSYDEILKVLALMGQEGRYPVLQGAPVPMESEQTAVDSPGARFIIEEAMRDDDMPLFVVFLGSITDMASALLRKPEIADRLTAVWIGGGEWPTGGFEFNLMQDIHAANVVFQSTLPLWQIPKNVYEMMKISITELQCKVRPYGEIGRYLFDQLVALNDACADEPWPQGESWCLGDQPTVSVLLETHTHAFHWKPAPRVSPEMFYIHGQNARPIRVYHYVDARMTFEDFFCKLMLHFPSGSQA